MATDTTYIETDPNGENGKRRNNVALILLLLLLLGSIGFNIYQYFEKERQTAQLNEKLVSSEDLKADMERLLDSTRGAMEEYKGYNEQLDSMVGKYQDELRQKEDAISKLIKEKKITFNQYIKAKEELDQLRYYANKYKKDIADRDAKIKELTAQNAELTEDNKTKKKAIDTLMDKTISLTNKISVYSQLKATDIKVSGVRFKGNNKERETDRGKNIEKFRVCFTIPENKLANTGSRDVFLQILDPRGQTISIEALGSGVTKVFGESTSYTTRDVVEFNNDKMDKCIYWGKGSGEYEEGKYTFKLYTEDYPMGEQSYYVR